MSTDAKATGAAPSRTPDEDLDDTDRRLLVALVEDPRRSRSALARAVGLSTPTVSSRLARLERRGVIRGYRVDLDPAAIGYAVSAWVRVRPGPGQLPKIVDLAERTPQVAECHRVTGEDCFVLRVHATSLADLEQLLDRFLLHGQTTSSVVVSSPVPARPLPMAP
jgi:Lrp/AsnC family transcriptional regulator, leucine-responsive regulatory protein